MAYIIHLQTIKLMYLTKIHLRLLAQHTHKGNTISKKKQGCEYIFLSPLFENKKYSDNKLLGVNKFNLISNKWATKLVSLAGINEKNYKKVFMTRCVSVAFNSWIISQKTKKPAHI